MAGTQRVVFDDKETFQESPLDEINKATADNYNELKSVINVNGQALDDILSITTGDVSAIQNTFTSDITAQTTGGGDPTFTLFDSTIDVTGRTSVGDVNFLHFKKTDTGTTDVFKVNIDGNITAAEDKDGTFIFGRTLINSRVTDRVYISHVARPLGSEFGMQITDTGRTTFNSASGQKLVYAIGNVQKWSIDGVNFSLICEAGIDLNLSDTSNIQFGGQDSITGDGTGAVTIANGKLNLTDRLALGLTTGDVASPLEGEIWYNNTSNKFRANENGSVVDMIGGGGGAFTADVDTQITPTTSIVLNHATNNEIALNIQYTVNKASGNDTGLLLNQTDTASPGTSLLLDLQKGGTSQVNINNAGDLTLETGDFFINSSSVFIKSAGATSMELGVNGTNIMKLTTAGFEVNTANGPGIRNTSSSIAVPVFNPRKVDLDTGLSGTGNDEVALVAGGIVGLQVSEVTSAVRIGFLGATPVVKAAAMTAATATVTNGTIGNADTIIDNLVIRVNELEAMLDTTTGVGIVV